MSLLFFFLVVSCCWWCCRCCDYDKASSRLVCDIDEDGGVDLPDYKDAVVTLLLKCGTAHARLLTGDFQRRVGRPFRLVGDCVGLKRGVVDGGWLLSEDARLRFRRLGVGADERRAAGVRVDVAAGERNELRLRLGRRGGGGGEFGKCLNSSTNVSSTSASSSSQLSREVEPSPASSSPSSRRRPLFYYCAVDVGAA